MNTLGFELIYLNIDMLRYIYIAGNCDLIYDFYYLKERDCYLKLYLKLATYKIMIYLAISSPNSSLVLGLGSASVTSETETKQVHSVACIYFEKVKILAKTVTCTICKDTQPFKGNTINVLYHLKKTSQGNVSTLRRKNGNQMYRMVILAIMKT
jgi:hypothetical protein